MGLNGYVYDFGADYDAIAVDDILDVYNHFMKKKCKLIECNSVEHSSAECNSILLHFND